MSPGPKFGRGIAGGHEVEVVFEVACRIAGVGGWRNGSIVIGRTRRTEC